MLERRFFVSMAGRVLPPGNHLPLMKNLLLEFKTFALKGNVMDLAVGVIIGAAFGKIVSSIVEDLIMPLIGAFWKVDFSNLYVPLGDGVTVAVTEAQKAGHPLSLAEARKF